MDAKYDQRASEFSRAKKESSSILGGGSGGGDRDWVGLPRDLLGSIAQRLAVKEYFRFGSVCTSWASAASVIVPRSPEMPYLLHLLSEGEGGGDAVLVSFPDRNQHRLTGVVDLRGKWLVGSQHGWLALLDQRSEVSLLNPLTRQKIRLPSVTTVDELTTIYDPVGSDQMSGYLFNHSRSEDLFYSFTFELFRSFSFRKVVLSSRPTILATGRGGGGGRGFTAMALFTGFNRIAIARPAEEKWILMRNWPSIPDIIYRNGKFLGVSDQGNLLAFDVTSPSPEVTEIARGWDDNKVFYTDKYLVDSAGDLLMVWRDNDDKGNIAITVMKFAEEQGAWLPLKSLGDNSLFLGQCCSVSLSVREIPELKPNCVYYTQQLWDWLEPDMDWLQVGQVGMRMPPEVWVFNLEDQTFDHYVPADHRLYWHPPIWITPSLL